MQHSLRSMGTALRTLALRANYYRKIKAKILPPPLSSNYFSSRYIGKLYRACAINNASLLVNNL